MTRMIRPLILFAAAGLSLAAATPRALAPAAGGLWEVGQSATGQGAKPTCIPSVVALAQWEHRGGRCTRVIISDTGNKAVVDYTCADGGFGDSKVTLITPRSLKIDTQGISGGLPFHYQRHARRVGDCPAR